MRVIRADQRLTQLAGMFESSTLKKTIIFTDSPLTAEAVHEVRGGIFLSIQHLLPYGTVAAW